MVAAIFFSNGDHNRILLLHPSEKKIYLNMQVRKKNEILKPKDMELFKWKFIYSKKSFLKIKANVVDHPEALMKIISTTCVGMDIKCMAASWFIFDCWKFYCFLTQIHVGIPYKC